MKLILDTQVLVWCDGEPHLISPAAKAAILDPMNEKLFSSASIWELAIKLALGKLKLNQPLPSLVAVQQNNGFDELPVYSRHAAGVESLPPIHKDPFDRLLVAQALVESAVLISCDQVIAKYPVKVLW